MKNAYINYKHSKLEVAEMEQRFNISGTHEELKAILEKEFNLSDEAARIATTVFVYEQNQEQKQDQLEEETLWFLNDSKNEYQSHFFFNEILNIFYESYA